MGTHPPRLRRVQLPPAKGYARVEMVFPVRNSPNNQVQLDGAVTDTATFTLPTPGSSDPGSQGVHLGRAGPPSLLALSRSEQIKSGPLSLSGVEKCREALRKNPRIWKRNSSERMTSGLQGAN